MVNEISGTAAAARNLKTLLLKEQVEENFRYALVASVAGVFNACVAIYAMWSPQNAWGLIVWGIAILSAAALRVANMHGHKPQSVSFTSLCRQQKWIEITAAYTSTVWAIGVVGMSMVADPTQFILVIMLCSGMMGASVTTYTSMAKAGIMFALPMAFGGLLCLWIGPDAPRYTGSLILASYCIIIARGAYTREARFLARIESREKLRESADTVKLLLNDFEAQSSDWLWEIDSNGNIQEPGPRFAEAAGRSTALLENQKFADLFEQGRERDILTDHIGGPFGFRNLTLKLNINQSPHWWTISAQPTYEGGMRGVASDVTAQKRAEERVSYMAHYDGLTDLANRFLFNDTLRRRLKHLPVGEELAVLCLDLDSFKSVNDTLGHPVGDQLLRTIARRIEQTVDDGDLVARLGGDEFAILISGPDARARTQSVSKQILSAIADSCLIDGLQIVSTTSIGVAYADNADAEATELMKHADLALYSAKAAGRNRMAEFEPGMDRAAEERRQLEMDLREAIRSNQFELYYQPLVDIENGKTTAYEALIRWNHPDRGVVQPDDFIPVAEETGLIIQLGEWVIRNACDAVAQWPDHLKVSVNLSPIQMRSSNLVGTIYNAVAHAGIQPGRLELEITENVLLNDSEINIATLHKLRDFGVRIALDDFGTGYSSLNYLRSFPFDKIKIDRCFVNDLENSADCRAIIRAVTSLASSLGMETTAEGVEDKEQLEQLRQEGCTQAQGYLFSRPSKSHEFTDLRRKRAPAVKAPIILPDNKAKPNDRDDMNSKEPQKKSKRAGK